MFVEKNNIDQMNSVHEADNNAAKVKPSCEVHGGNLFVQLHFKAIEKVPNTVELINTVVTVRDESSAKFAGYGKHLVAVRSTDEESPLTRTDAIKHIKAYFGTMFGQDVGNSLKDKDIHTIDEKGQEMNAEALKKWEEQQNKKSDDEEDKKTIDESIPSFGRFILEDDIEDDDFNGDIEGESGGDGSEGESGGDDDDAESAGDVGDDDDIEGEVGGDEDEDEEAGDEIPPPSTYIVCYGIKAEGQPDTDHTDSKTIEQLDPKGNLKIPGSNHEWGIKFSSTLGGGSDDLNLKKLGKEMAGKVDSDELTRQLNIIMRANFPTINTPDINVRDNKTINIELNKKTKKQGDADPEIDPAGYNSKLKAALANSEYSLWISVTDYREKPFVHEADIANVINAAVKKVGGWWAKKLSGIKPADVFMLHGMSKMSKEETEQDEVKRLIPKPSEIKAIIDKNKIDKNKIDKNKGENSQIISEIDKRFDKVIKKNNTATDSTAAAAIKKWNVFKKDNNKPESLDHKVFIDFYNDYLKFYNKTVLPMLSEEFVSSQELMQEIFGILYEDDTGDEKSEVDSGDIDDDFEDDGGDEGSSDDKSEDGKKDEVTNIFIVPMKGIDVKIDNSGSW